jgi:hypothetical protein
MNALSPTIAFALQAATPSAAAGTWMPGTSTNFGTDAVTVPDYLFDPNAQPTTNSTTLTVQDPLDMVTATLAVGMNASGTPTATPPVAIKVTSQDFGGKAYLRAALTLAPGVPPIYAGIVDPVSGSPVTAPVNNQAIGGTCGTDFANQPFASLPVDQDCNGIADWWEGQYTNPAGGHLNPTDDNDVDATGTNASSCGVQATGAYPPPGSCGDGFTAFDEYRGFHVINDNTGAVEWISTDPTKLDVFWWDSSSEIMGEKLFAQSVQALLIPQTNGFIAWHQLNRQEARAVADTQAPKQGAAPYQLNSGVSVLNNNNPVDDTAAAPAFGYAIMYYNYDQGRDVHGTCNASLLIARAQVFGRNGTPILVSPATLAACATSSNTPLNVLAALTLAHETGHQLSLQHYNRSASLIPTPPPASTVQYIHLAVPVPTFVPGLVAAK